MNPMSLYLNLVLSRTGRGGLSQRVLSASYWLHFFIAIRIRVKDFSLLVWLSCLGVPHKTKKIAHAIPTPYKVPPERNTGQIHLC
jgi:hypothetical protein